ncbi:(2Fe-2S)-binding protein [Streptomyces sp. NBC_01023]|uniref:(2Fe-2S)-binding protein n=1 Tax=Streptomyces sp. NBC_01023 TaxID=2903724 RepID=UPI00386467A6|nr:(2Fe-2S)-binding protein [Streptomyces sp. NBC_01023]
MSSGTQPIESVGPGEDVRVAFMLNGQQHDVEVPTSTVLLTMLRRDLNLTGVRGSCERGVCGVCTVLVDDRPVASCSLFAFDVDGTSVETIEGQQDGDHLSPVQQAFSECGGFQCGYCTPGMILLTTALLRTNAKPDREEVRQWIGSNICRCTGYEMILEAVERAGELVRDRDEEDNL